MRISDWSSDVCSSDLSFQSLELFDDISVEENIRAGSELRASRRSWVTDLFWPGHHDLTSTAVAAVREFSLEECLDQTPEELPYGRRPLVGDRKSPRLNSSHQRASRMPPSD